MIVTGAVIASDRAAQPLCRRCRRCRRRRYHYYHQQSEHSEHIAQQMTDTATGATDDLATATAAAPGAVIDGDCLRALVALATSKYDGDAIVFDEAFCRSMGDERWRRTHQLAISMTEAVVTKEPREGATSAVNIALHRAARIGAQHPKTTAQRAVHELQRRELEAAAPGVTPQQACDVRMRLLEDRLLTGQAKLMRLSSENAELRRVADSLRAQYNEQLNAVAAIKQQLQQQRQPKAADAAGATVVESPPPPPMTHARVDALLGDSEHQAHVLDDMRRRAEQRAAPPPPPMPQPPKGAPSGGSRRIARLTPEQAAATKHAARTVLAKTAADAVARDGGSDDLVKQLASAVLKRRSVIGGDDDDDKDANAGDDEAWTTSAAAHADIKRYVRRHRHRHRHAYARPAADVVAVARQPPLF
jgi:hypothetical protein